MKAVNGDNPETNELWSVIAGSNDNQLEEETKKKGKKTKERSVNPAKRKRATKEEKSPEELAAIVEQLLAEFEIAYEDDAVLNAESKPCISKLRKLPLLIEYLSKKPLQKAFIDHGVFTLLKNWLEPLPDGSLPNWNIRQAILTILTEQFQFDVNQYFVKDQLKKSGLGKVIMFLSQSEEETAANQKLAKELVYKWSRGLYNISTRFEDARPTTVERIPKRPCIRKPEKKAPVPDAFEQEFYDFSSGHRKIGKSNIMSRAQVPEPASMSFVVAPPSKVARTCGQENQRHINIMKTLRQFKVQKRKSSDHAVKMK